LTTLEAFRFVRVVFPSVAHQAKALVSGEYEGYMPLCEQNGHTIGWRNREARWKGSVIEDKRFVI
jgi:hypothetical protein